MKTSFKIILVIFTSLIMAVSVFAVETTHDSLPPAAQEAINKGIMAAKLPDYLLAIRYFEEARKIAPQAPVVYLNMGLAESKIPGRELRAMAWFGAYLAAYPEAPNVAAVKEQIALLEVRNQSNVSRLIKSVQDAASQLSGESKEYYLRYVAGLWAKAGDITVAFRVVDLLQDRTYPVKSWALLAISAAQAKDGDIASALKTADLIPNEQNRHHAQNDIAVIQAESGDVAGALKFADSIRYKDSAQAGIVKAQAKSGDIRGALKTVDLIKEEFSKSLALAAIAEAQMQAGDLAGAKSSLSAAEKIAAFIQDGDRKSYVQKVISETLAKADIANESNATRNLTDPHPPSQAVITGSHWLTILDDNNKSNDCPLNTEPFLDLAGYLKSLPSSDNLLSVYDALYKTAEKIVKAQNVITRMLRQEAKK